MYSTLPGKQPSLLGPCYIEGSPLLENNPGEPFELTQCPDEPGDVF